MITVGVFCVFGTEDPAKLHDHRVEIIGSKLMFQSQMHSDVRQGHRFTTNCAVRFQHCHEIRVPPELIELPGDQPEGNSFECSQWEQVTNVREQFRCTKNPREHKLLVCLNAQHRSLDQGSASVARSTISPCGVTSTAIVLEQCPPKELEINRALSHKSFMMLM